MIYKKSLPKNMILTIISVISILFLLITGTLILNYDSDNYSEKQVTLMEAYSKLKNIALDWNEHATLINMTSVDIPDSKQYKNFVGGLCGKKREWTAIFHSANIDKSLIISIKDGQVISKNVVNEDIREDHFISLEKTPIDSSKALEMSIEHYNLEPGKGWAHGYNYAINKSNGKNIITVLGQDKDGYFTKVYFDIDTGKLIFSEHQVPINGKLYKNGQNINISNENNISVLSGKVSPNFVNDKTIIVCAIINPLTPHEKKGNYISRDGGLNWLPISFQNEANNFIFSDKYKTDNTIYAIHSKNVYISRNAGLDWTQILNTDTKIKGSDYSNGMFAVLTDENLFMTTNGGSNWNIIKIPERTSMTKIDNGVLYILSDNKVMKFSSSSWVSITLPINNITGFSIIDNHIICYNMDLINFYDNNTKKVVSEIANESPVKSIFKENNNYYFVCEDGNLFTYKEGGVKIDLIKNIAKFSDEKVAYVSGNVEELFYNTVAQSQWDIIQKYK